MMDSQKLHNQKYAALFRINFLQKQLPGDADQPRIQQGRLQKTRC
jgi:hypothetical protein